MTRESNHKELFTPFSEWIRNCHHIRSEKKFTLTDIDFVWKNYETGYWILMEEKCKMSDLTFAQEKTFVELDKTARNDPYYNGFYVVRFENTTPDDGNFVVRHLEFGEFRVTSMPLFLEFVVSENTPNDRKVWY